MSAAAEMIQTTIRKIGESHALDKVGNAATKAVAAVTRPKAVMNALSGTWLGHQLHPVLTDVPIGAWGAAAVLDLTAGEQGAASARRLVGLGILAAVPTAASGAADWSTTYGANKRVGLVHGLTNATATTLQAASWLVRRRSRGLGVALSLTALGITAASAYLGGHLSFRRGIGVDHTAFQPAVKEWTEVAAEADLADEAITRVTVRDVPVALVKRAGRVTAISAVCSHAGGPLDKGELDRDGCVTCPWHGSRFHTDDGSVERGPATAPQPAWDVRIEDGRVLVRSAAG